MIPMPSAVLTVRREFPRERPWLVVGKGPTASRLPDVAARKKYHVLTLNHAVHLCRPTLAHFIDLDALLACRDRITAIDAWVVLPWHPHENHKPSKRTIADIPELLPFAGRLVSYNSSTAGKLPRHPDLPDVTVRKFSAVAAFNLLLRSGVKEIHSVGVDGGIGYAPGFDTSTHLANGQPSFDAQTPFLARAVKKAGATWVRL